LRFRAVYAGANSTKGYDSQGNKVENGLKVSVNRSVAVLEYGLTDMISGQFLMNYSLGGKVQVEDETKFTTAVVNPTIESLAGATIDSGVSDLKKAIAAGLTGSLGALYNGSVNQGLAPTGGVDLSKVNAKFAGVTIPEGANVKDFIDNKLRGVLFSGAVAANSAAVKQKAEGTEFQKGLGDIEVGVKASLSTVSKPWFDGIPFYTSAGVGVRLDTSKYKDAIKDGKKPAGRGTTDLGIRLNADYEPLSGLQFQAENQTELQLAKGKSYANGAEVDYSREGMREVGYLKMVLAPGTWIPSAEFLMLNARYNWDNDAKTKTGDVESAGTVGRSAQAGLSLDGLKLQLPVQLDYDHVFA
ncbi:hypothetical protein EBU99_15295, partial [bacterium]|nr:hypothetical protein [bacterium]